MLLLNKKIRTLSAGILISLCSLHTHADLSDCNSTFAPNQISLNNEIDGTWSENSVCVSGNGSGDNLVLSTTEAEDFVYSAKLKILSGRAAALAFRVSENGDSAYYATIDADQDGVKLWKRDSGTEVLSFVNHNISRNQFYKLKITIVGARIRISIDNTEIIDITDDNPLNTGLLGANVYNSESIFQEIDYADLEDIDWAAPTIKTVTGESSGNGFYFSSEQVTDIDLQADITVESDGHSAGFAFYSKFDDDNFSEGYVADLNVKDGGIKLWGKGGFKSVFVDYPLNFEQQYNLRLTTQGDLISVYVDDRLVVRIQDSKFSSGRIGLHTWDGQAEFKNVKFNNTLVSWPGLPLEEADSSPPSNTEDFPIHSNVTSNNFDHVHEVVIDQLQLSKATSAVVAIKDEYNNDVFEAGYGWLDREKSNITRYDSLFRSNSISKSFTRNAIEHLESEGWLDLDAPVFCFDTNTASGCLLETGLNAPNSQNARLISVRHLIHHLAGWDEGIADTNGVKDPLGDSDKIAAILGVNNPPSHTDLIKYRLSQPLDYDISSVTFLANGNPTSASDALSSYSSWGYTLLSLIIEKKSGVDLVDYIHSELAPPGISSADLLFGEELKENRNPREPEYIPISSSLVQNLFAPQGNMVLKPDGGYHVGNALGGGGLISTANALLSVFAHNNPGLGYGGSGPGSNSRAIAWHNENKWAWLMNSRHNNEGFADRMETAIRGALERNETKSGFETSTKYDSLLGFNLEEDAQALSFELTHAGTENCEALPHWHKSIAYNIGDAVIHEGRKYSAKQDHDEVEPQWKSGRTTIEWGNSDGICESTIQIAVKRSDKPQFNQGDDCTSIGTGSHSCSITTAEPGFYYISLRSIDHDATEISIKVSYDAATTISGSETIEAEDYENASLVSPFISENSGEVTYMVWSGSNGINNSPGDFQSGQLHYSLVPTSTSVTLYSTVDFSHLGNDSFFYKLEGYQSSWAFKNNTTTNGFEELSVVTWNGLTIGQPYTLKIQRREDGAKIDSFRLSGGVFSSGNGGQLSNNIEVRMRGASGGESVTLSVGGTNVQTWTLSSSMTTYQVDTDQEGEIRVAFTNDSSGRDVQVDYIVVNGVTRQAEDQNDNTGAWSGSCGGGTYSEWLHCNGSIGFGNL